MQPLRRWCEGQGARATKEAASEQEKVHVPQPSPQSLVPPDSGHSRRKAVAGQRWSNICRGSEVLGRAEPASGLVEESLGPLKAIGKYVEQGRPIVGSAADVDKAVEVTDAPLPPQSACGSWTSHRRPSRRCGQ